MVAITGTVFALLALVIVVVIFLATDWWETMFLAAMAVLAYAMYSGVI